MRGVVEIYANNKLILKEDNLLMDGASELLADIMTVSPSLSGLGVDELDPATSSILDASNYMIQAISFGTAQNTYQTNAHYFSEEKANLLSGTYPGEEKIIVIQQKDPSVTNTDKTVSSYSPINLMPHNPDPTLTSLEVGSDVSAVLHIQGYLAEEPVSSVPVSAVIRGNGQNLNLIPSAHNHAFCINTPLSAVSSLVGSIVGCWPAALDPEGNGGTSFSGFDNNPSGTQLGAASVIYSGTLPQVQVPSGVPCRLKGTFNAASSMDTSGFVNMIMSGTPHTLEVGPGLYEMSSTYSGLCVSGSSNLSGDGTGEPVADGVVEYSVTIGAGDVAGANFYGGIYNMGLWTIDMDKSLRAGNTPPYSFDPLNNPRRYKLFSTKSFTRNIARITDDISAESNGVAGCISYDDLLIKWRIHFL